MHIREEVQSCFTCKRFDLWLMKTISWYGRGELHFELQMKSLDFLWMYWTAEAAVFWNEVDFQDEYGVYWYSLTAAHTSAQTAHNKGDTRASQSPSQPNRRASITTWREGNSFMNRSISESFTAAKRKKKSTHWRKGIKIYLLLEQRTRRNGWGQY